MIGSKKVIFGVAAKRTDDLILLGELIEAGKSRPILDRSYSLEGAAEAHSYVETGRKKGNVVITVEHNDKLADQLLRYSFDRRRSTDLGMFSFVRAT